MELTAAGVLNRRIHRPIETINIFETHGISITPISSIEAMSSGTMIMAGHLLNRERSSPDSSRQTVQTNKIYEKQIS